MNHCAIIFMLEYDKLLLIFKKKKKKMSDRDRDRVYVLFYCGLTLGPPGGGGTSLGPNLPDMDEGGGMGMLV